MEVLNVVDNDAAERIVAGCRAKAPDATHEELVALCREAAKRYRGMRSVANPIGMLIRHLPNSFENPAFNEFRKAERQLREAEERRREAERQQWCRILDDPTETEEVKQIAREVLGQGSNNESTLNQQTVHETQVTDLRQSAPQNDDPNHLNPGLKSEKP